MKIAFFSSKSYDQEYFTSSNEAYGHELNFFEARLNKYTARLATDHDAWIWLPYTGF